MFICIYICKLINKKLYKFILTHPIMYYLKSTTPPYWRLTELFKNCQKKESNKLIVNKLKVQLPFYMVEKLNLFGYLQFENYY